MAIGVCTVDSGLKEFPSRGGDHDPDEGPDEMEEALDEFVFLPVGTDWYSTKSPSPASSPSESSLIGSSGVSSESPADFGLLISRLGAVLPGSADAFTEVMKFAGVSGVDNAAVAAHVGVVWSQLSLHPRTIGVEALPAGAEDLYRLPSRTRTSTGLPEGLS